MLEKDSDIIRTYKINLFAKIFNNANHRKEFLISVNGNESFMNNQSLNEYIYNRNNLFERTITSLNNNVKNTITSIFDSKFVTLPVNTEYLNNEKCKTIFITNNESVDNSVIFGNEKFEHSALNIKSHNLPIFPLNIKMNVNTNQGIRQWIRTIYKQTHSLAGNSDFITYYSLIDLTYAYINTDNEDVRESYRTLMLIMLDRNRFNENIKEIVYLETNEPKIVGSSCNDNIDEILAACRNNNRKLQNRLLWFCIVLITKNKKVIENQYNYCKFDIKNSLDIENDDLDETEFNIIKNKLFCKLREIPNKVLEFYTKEKTYDYTCPILLDDNSNTGGYIIKPHKINNYIKCEPQFVLSDMCKETLLENADYKSQCPICSTQLFKDDFEKIGKKKTVNQEDLNNLKILREINNMTIISDMYDNTKIEEIKLTSYSDKLINMDKLSFVKNPYKIITGDMITIKPKMDKYVVETITSEEFRNSVSKRYDFLKNINFKNICIAGGFCRSILLNQSVNDIDFFIYGIKSNDDILKRSKSFVKNVVSSVLNENKNAQFIAVHKNNNKVLELFFRYHICCHFLDFFYLF